MSSRVLRQITELQDLSLEALKVRWRDLYGIEPPRYSRAHLVKRLAYRVQELAFGGVSDLTRAKLREHNDDGPDGSERLRRRKQNDGTPVVGTRLIREWHGHRYEVTVVADGFEHAGRRYRSLSAVARAITGTHWNGRAFFGLTHTRRRKQK